MLSLSPGGCPRAGKEGGDRGPGGGKRGRLEREGARERTDCVRQPRFRDLLISRRETVGASRGKRAIGASRDIIRRNNRCPGAILRRRTTGRRISREILAKYPSMGKEASGKQDKFLNKGDVRFKRRYFPKFMFHFHTGN